MVVIVSFITMSMLLAVPFALLTSENIENESILGAGTPTVAKIAAGENHTVTVKNDGTVWASGYNGYGQLGDGTSTNRYSPVQVVGLTNVIGVSAGKDHTLALKSDGTVWAWGRGNNGQLGDGTSTNRSTPVQVVGLTNVIDIAAGGLHSVALKSDGTVWTWGYNTSGQLGSGSLTYTPRTIPAQVTGLTNVTAVAAGYAHTLALKSDGSVWAWGDNLYGQVGYGTWALTFSSPIQVAVLSDITSIAAGLYHSVAVKDSNTVWAWGSNSDGELGNGTTTNRNTPVQAIVNFGSPLTNVIDIGAGYYFTVALRTDGTVWTWGDNYYGQIGDGTNTDRATPAQVSGLSGISAVAAGGHMTLALKNDGTKWAWGDNYYGQIGDGTTTRRTTPVQVGVSNDNNSNLILIAGIIVAIAIVGVVAYKFIIQPRRRS